MIIGVALVVDELNKGQRLVCRYPISIPSTVFYSHPTFSSGLLQFHKEYLSISSDNFAKLFRPKAQLFNKILELTIDDIHYISYPCPCSDESSSNSQASIDLITLFNVVIAIVKESAMKKLLDKTMEYDSSSSSSSSSSSNSNTDSDYASSSIHIAGFEPISAIMGLRGKIKSINPTILRSVVERFSKALLFHEKRNRYVSKQVAIMLRLIESNANTSTTHGIYSDNDLFVMDMMLQQSTLANELRSVFHGLTGGHSINLTVNHVLSLNMRLCNEISDSKDYKDHETILLVADCDKLLPLVNSLYSASNTTLKTITNIPQQLLVNPLLLLFLKHADPTKSFTEIAQLMDEPLCEVISVANQLCYWELGYMITTITNDSIYRVNKSSPVGHISKAARVFLSKFGDYNHFENNDDPDVSLPYILSLFNGGRKLRDVIEILKFSDATRSNFIDITVWLLQWKLIVIIAAT